MTMFKFKLWRSIATKNFLYLLYLRNPAHPDKPSVHPYQCRHGPQSFLHGHHTVDRESTSEQASSKTRPLPFVSSAESQQNDHIFLSHSHDIEDGFINLENASEVIEDDRSSSSSVVHKSIPQRSKDGVGVTFSEAVRPLQPRRKSSAHLTLGHSSTGEGKQEHQGNFRG